MNSKWKDEHLDALFRAILTLKTPEECAGFFEDLCTITELKAMTQRFHVARLLSEGNVYSDVVQKTGASTATISRVNRCLHYGSDGYATVIPRLPK